MSWDQLDFTRLSPLTFLLVYLGGILTSFTPCVYPLIPITAGFVGARSAGSKSRGFFLSLFYVLGLAAVYSILGMVAAFTGSLFGSINSHPITLIIMGNIYVVLALFLLGVFNFQVSLGSSESLQKAAVQRGKKDWLGSFLIGASSALVAGPCTAPVLGALLVWIGKEHNWILGGLLMFLFSLGLGTLLLLVGTFAGLAAALPKSGGWMRGVKILFALLVLVAAEYFLIQAGKALF